MAFKCGKIAAFVIFILSLTYQVLGYSKRSIDLIETQDVLGNARLPTSVTPTCYRLWIQPLPHEHTFSGIVRINVSFHEDTNLITLHADEEIEVPEKSITVTQFSSDEYLTPASMMSAPINVTRVERQDPSIIVIVLERDVKKQAQCELVMHFSGKITTDSSQGIFKHQHIDPKTGHLEWFVATRFRPNFARKVFPCFDEPAFKAQFTISIARQENVGSLSNTALQRVEKIKDQPGWYWDHYEETPKLSTFSTGFIVSRFVNDRSNTSFEGIMKRALTGDRGTRVRVWARPEYSEGVRQLSEKVTTLLGILGDFWNEPYPLPKLDIVALPTYQATKPTDNFGLIFFKESELTYKKTWYVAQELVYQWVGAIVTPDWWDDALINNALSRYMTAYATLKVNSLTRSEHDTFNNWPMTTLYSIYYEFSKRYPHSKNTAIKQDSASAKTEMIFRMLNYILGEWTFKQAMQNFMARKKYNTFTGIQLWGFLTEQARLDNALPDHITVFEIATSWMLKDRLPVVHVIRDYDDNSANVTQQVYLRERPHDVPGQHLMFWIIPIVLVQENDMDFKSTYPIAWMKLDRSFVMYDMPTSEYFIIVNPEEIAPFPVNYDTRNWRMLANYLANNEKRKNIPVTTRAKLLHDAWNLAYAGELSFDTALNMTLFLKYEREYVAWDPIFTMIDHLGRHIDHFSLQRKFQAFVRHLLEPLYVELEADSESSESDGTEHLKSSSKTFLCQAGYRPCIEEAEEAFGKWMAMENPEEGNPVANQYLCPVFQWGTMAEFEFGLERILNFPSTRKQNERTYLLKTLASCPDDAGKIQKLLNVSVLEGKGNFTDNDLSLIFNMIAGETNGCATLYEFLETHWETLKAKFDENPYIWNALVSAATSMKTRDGLNKVKDLYKRRRGELGTADFVVEKAIRNLREESEWSNDNLPVIEKWLDWYIKYNDINIDL